MERRQVELEVASLDISEAKADYIATKGVAIADVTEVFENRPRFFSETTAGGNVRYSFLGPTLGDRFLLVAIAPVDLEAGAWRLISAYWLRIALSAATKGTETMNEPDDVVVRDLERAIDEGRELENARPVPARTARKLTVTFAIRLSAEEQREFQQAAEAQGMSLADFMRSATRAAAGGELDISAARNIDRARKAAQDLSEALSHL